MSQLHYFASTQINKYADIPITPEEMAQGLKDKHNVCVDFKPSRKIDDALNVYIDGVHCGMLFASMEEQCNYIIENNIPFTDEKEIVNLMM